ncbi:MAG: transporter [Rhizomicrobium sp.]|nr:transporter [Rhizomicrobium sp.]
MRNGDKSTGWRAVPWSGVLLALACPALAGPPFVTDDPQPTDAGHFEIYAFAQGAGGQDGAGASFGIDFNYGAAPDLQLTAVLPIETDMPKQGPSVSGLGNIELAAKYKFLHQEDFGWDVAVFPRVFLPSASKAVGDQHASLLLPLWAGRDWGQWSTFGGGGCVLNRGGDAQDYCLAGWALTRHVLPNLTLGAELVHQSADVKGGRASTGAGAGLIYDFNENLHLLAYAGPGLQNTAETQKYSWYSSLLFTF